MHSPAQILTTANDMGPESERILVMDTQTRLRPKRIRLECHALNQASALMLVAIIAIRESQPSPNEQIHVGRFSVTCR